MKKTKEKAVELAEELGENANENDKENLEKKLPKMKRGAIRKIWDKVLYLYGVYKKADIPTSLQVTVIGALLYLVLPVDVLPDYVPGIGLLDDLSVILLVFKEVSKYAIPKAVEKITDEIQESCFIKIDEGLEKAWRKIFLFVIATFGINCIAFSIIAAKPFGRQISLIVAIGIFSILAVVILAVLINYLQKYGKILKAIVSDVFKTKSITKGIENFILEKYPLITKVYAGIDFAQDFVPGLNSIPDFEKILEVFVKHYKKRVFLLALFVILYVIVIIALQIFLVKTN